MNDAQPEIPSGEAADPTGPIERAAGDPTRSVMPFVLAAVVAILVLGGIVLAAVRSPVEKNVTETERVVAAVYDFAEMSGRYGLTPPEGAVCADFDPARSPLVGLSENDGSGKAVTVDELDDLRISGDEATVEVTVTVDGRAVTDTWHPVRAHTGRRVCNQPVRS
ncbi:Rv0361 family membrane protein [Nocardia paucivorans]|uniref:Rv0361 family membrane protein n=1 Tax=Nocardia paucivorans TaxID=114259 RepID=UPI0002E399E0|nr:hypothetical protein [Nocardia paucivorans]